jgi:hypothetical protein
MDWRNQRENRSYEVLNPGSYLDAAVSILDFLNVYLFNPSFHCPVRLDLVYFEGLEHKKKVKHEKSVLNRAIRQTSH